MNLSHELPRTNKIKHFTKLQRFATIILLLANLSAFSQTEKPESKTTSAFFEKYYNAGQHDSIFAMFADVMKTALPVDKTKELVTGLTQQLGKIKTREFVKYEQTYASYKTQFDKAIFIVNISVDDQSKINGLFFKPYIKAISPERNSAKFALPFKDEWTVIWGGDTKEQNYHVVSAGQKNAFDIVIKDEKGNSFKTSGKQSDDYYAFGKDLTAPCDGEVVMAVDGIKDNLPGVMNPTFVTGNLVIIKASASEFVYLCHFKQRSIKVKQGEKVKRGQLLGQCGNSGNSSEPHLHLHIQNIELMSDAIGVKCYFESLMVNGAKKEDYSPIQGDKISQP